VGVRAFRNGRGGAGAASTCVMGTESTTCAWTFGDDKTDRQGPTNQRERARERTGSADRRDRAGRGRWGNGRVQGQEELCRQACPTM
jgi:hypothetical protein